jgi:tetratricopeptide (TPR) repeat protein
MSRVDSKSIPNSFVGRERELAELRAGLEDAAAGRGRMFLISGEPGIGKTRLANELAMMARERGIRAVWGRCWEGGGAPAYWPWIQVIRGCLNSADLAERRSVLESEHASSMVETIAQIVPELHALAPRALRPAMTPRPDPPQTQFRLFDSVATLLKDFARLQPLLVLIDDLHDADYASLMMLRLIAQGLASAGILIVGTHRDLEVRRSPELSKHIGDLSREARCLPLSGLNQAEVAHFVELSSGQTPDDKVVARLHAATAGNPLFVDGVVRMLRGDHSAGNETPSHHDFKIPDTVREAIRRRLAMLPDEAHSLLKVAAVIGNEFDADLCLRVGEVSRDEFNLLLDEASTGGIVMPLGQGRYRFTHALVRGAVCDALDTNTRVRLHRKIAEPIEEIHAKDLAAHLGELAHHFREAGVSEKAIEYFHRAAKAARAVFAYAVAADHWREGLALSEGQNDTRRAEMLHCLGEVAAFFLNPEEGIKSLEAALNLYRQLENYEKVAVENVILGLAQVSLSDFGSLMNVPRSLEYFRQAQEWKGEWTDRLIFGYLHHGMGTALFQTIRIDEAITALDQARQVFVAASYPAWVTSSSLHAQLLMIKGRVSESVAAFGQILRAAGDMADPEQFRWVTWHAGWCRMTMRDPLEARHFFTMGLERPGLSPHQREGHFEFLALTELLAGNLSRAKALAAEHRVNPTFRSFISFREANWEAATEMNLAMLEWARRTGHRWDEANTLSILFENVFVTGDLERATEFLRQALGAYEPSDLFWEIRIRPDAALLAIAAGRTEEAIAHLEVCRAIIEQGEDWSGRAGLVARAEAVLAAAQRRDFAPHFERSISILKRYCLPWDEADTLYHWGLALNAAGEHSNANEKFDAAIELYRRHGGGQRWIDRVEAARPSTAAARTSPKPAEASSGSATFREESDFWAITHNGNSFRLRSIKGLAYIARLLGRPGERVHVIDLVQAIEGVADGRINDADAAREGLKVQRGLGDAGEVLDAQARDEYRQRQIELRAELEDAQRQNDPGRVEAARHELELLTDELTAAVGRGGHARKNLAHVERARSLVTKHIRSGLDLIRRHDAKLGSHLDRSIQTGVHCAYLPEAGEKIAWQL